MGSFCRSAAGGFDGWNELGGQAGLRGRAERCGLLGGGRMGAVILLLADGLEFSMERVYLNRKEHTVLRNNTFS